MRCKACDAEMVGSSAPYRRVVTLPDGEKIEVDEDLCLHCRSKIFEYSLPEDFDFMEGLGYDIDR